MVHLYWLFNKLIKVDMIITKKLRHTVKLLQFLAPHANQSFYKLIVLFAIIGLN